MQIKHKIDDFLFEIFPKAKKANNDLDVLKEELANYYTYGPYKPKVNIEGGGWISIDIDTPTILLFPAECPPYFTGDVSDGLVCGFVALAVLLHKKL